MICAEEHGFSSPIRASPRPPTHRCAGIGSCPSTRSAERASPPSLPASRSEIVAALRCRSGPRVRRGSIRRRRHGGGDGGDLSRALRGVGVHSGLPYGSATDLAFRVRGDAGRCRSREDAARGSARRGRRRPSHAHHRLPRRCGQHRPSVERRKIVGCSPRQVSSVERAEARLVRGRTYTRTVIRDKSGTVVVEQWLHPRQRPCLVRRQRGWHLHRSARPRCLTRNAALLS